MKKLILCFLLAVCSFGASPIIFSQEPAAVQVQDVPELDSSVLQSIEQIKNALETLQSQVPAKVETEKDLQTVFTSIWGFVSILLTYLFRNSQKALSFIGKIKSNGVLALIAGGISLVLGFTVMKGEVSLTFNSIFQFLTGTVGVGTIIYVILKAVTKGKSETPAAPATT